MLAFIEPKVRSFNDAPICAGGRQLASRDRPHRLGGGRPIDRTFGKDLAARTITDDRDPMVEVSQQGQIQIDVDDDHGDTTVPSRLVDESERSITERTTDPGQELDTGWVHAITIFLRAMRPFTAFVVIGLLVLIVVAFVIKLQTTGFTP